MTGSLYRGQAGLPFSSTLRVYEPLDAFPEEQRQAIQEAGARTASRAAVENAELLASAGAHHALRRRPVPHRSHRPGARHERPGTLRRQCR